MKYSIPICLIAICSSLAVCAAHAQERIYAVSGVVTSMNSTQQMTELNTDDGSSSHFLWVKTPPPPMDFDKSVREDSIPVPAFTGKGDHAIVFFYGFGFARTAVAVRDLGTGPVTFTPGTVTKLDRKDRILTVQKPTGEEVTFHLDAKTVVATSDGVREDFKYGLSKGEPVRVTSTQVSGADTAWLVTPPG